MQDALEDARRDRVPELSNADSRREDEANLPAADFLVPVSYTHLTLPTTYSV